MDEHAGEFRVGGGWNSRGVGGAQGGQAEGNEGQTKAEQKESVHYHLHAAAGFNHERHG